MRGSKWRPRPFERTHANIPILPWPLLELLSLVGVDLKTDTDSSLLHNYKNMKTIVYKNVKDDRVKAGLMSTFSLSWCS